MASTRHPGSLLKVLDLDKKEFLALLALARDVKQARADGTERRQLVGRNIALIFEKASTRTRCAFEVAAHDQGAHITYLGPDGSHIGSGESIADTARVLGRMFDGIEFRGFAQASVEQLADYAGVPVWNGLTTEWHPTQMLADILTMTEHHDGPMEQIAYCFLGDGRNNVARSLLVTGALLGMDVRIAAPRELWPPADVIEIAHALAADSGARVLVTDDPARGVEGVDFVYTDVWVSMGESDADWATRVPMLRPYRVTAELMAATGRGGTKFLHCLPSLHNTDTDLGRRLHEQFGLDGAEVTNAVFESPASIVFDQAENRLHTIKAVMLHAFSNQEMNAMSTRPADLNTTREALLAEETPAAEEVPAAVDTTGVVERFVVGVDGSAQSIEALRWATRIASGVGAHIDVVTTWEPQVGMVGPFIATPGRSDSPKDDAQAVLERARDAAWGGSRPPHVTLRARQGEAAHILIEESRTAQLLVVGSRGLGRVAGLLLGSVSAHCAEQARCPVLIMHEPDQP